MSASELKFTARELDRCLRHYDLGKLESVHQFRWGSHHSAKALIKTDRGQFFFKRRAADEEAILKANMAHHIQACLSKSDFPLPRLIPTLEGSYMLIRRGMLYEMFDYLPGKLYQNYESETREAGQLLSRFHQLLRDFHHDYIPPDQSCHRHPGVIPGLRLCIGSFWKEEGPPENDFHETISRLEDLYETCCQQLDDLGMNTLTRQWVHGDWHPGNLVFENHHVIAVLDYDSARMRPRIFDVAYGVMNFSRPPHQKNISQWHSHRDLDRYRYFMQGYHHNTPLSEQEIRMIPGLVCEAMISEPIFPIVQTGRFGDIDGFAFLQMVLRQANWVLENAELLQAIFH